MKLIKTNKIVVKLKREQIYKPFDFFLAIILLFVAFLRQCQQADHSFVSKSKLAVYHLMFLTEHHSVN